MSSSMITVAVVQEQPVFLNLNASLDVAEKAVRDAANQGAKVAAFAECWLTGYPVWLDYADKVCRWGDGGATALFARLSDESVTLGDAATIRLQALADETGTIIAMGTHERRGGTLTNTAMTFIPGLDAPSLRRKLVPTYTERLVWGRGDGSTLKPAETEFGPLSTLICWEHWMPLLRAATHAQSPILHVSQWPTVSDPHLTASKHIAFEGRVPVLAAGSVLKKSSIIEGYRSGKTRQEGLSVLESMDTTDGDWIHTGGSTIIGPDGTLMIEQAFKSEGVYTADIDLSIGQEGRLTLDVVGHYSRPDLFDLSVNTKPQHGIRFGGQ